MVFVKGRAAKASPQSASRKSLVKFEKEQSGVPAINFCFLRRI